MALLRLISALRHIRLVTPIPDFVALPASLAGPEINWNRQATTYHPVRGGNVRGYYVGILY
jgi:hypothetical protein